MRLVRCSAAADAELDESTGEQFGTAKLQRGARTTGTHRASAGRLQLRGREVAVSGPHTFRLRDSAGLSMFRVDRLIPGGIAYSASTDQGNSGSGQLTSDHATLPNGTDLSGTNCTLDFGPGTGISFTRGQAPPTGNLAVRVRSGPGGSTILSLRTS